LGNLRISPDSAFSVNWTAFSIFIVMVGGIATIEGPIIGVLVFYLLNRLFADYGTWYLVGLGLLAILVTTRYPKGIWGIVSARLGLHLFPVQRRLVADVRQSPVSTQGGHSRGASRV
jgi:branched-chain amino acid transport system permease protein